LQISIKTIFIIWINFLFCWHSLCWNQCVYLKTQFGDNYIDTVLFVGLFWHALCFITSASRDVFLCLTFFRKKKPATMSYLIMAGKKGCDTGIGSLIPFLNLLVHRQMCFLLVHRQMCYLLLHRQMCFLLVHRPMGFLLVQGQTRFRHYCIDILFPVIA